MADETETKTIEATLSDERYEAFETAVEAAGSSLGEVLTKLIEQYVQQQESIDAYVNRDKRTKPNTSTLSELMVEVPPPVGVLLDFTLISVESGRATIEFEPGPKHANPMGTLHGGIFCDIGDAAMGTAYASTLSENETFTTLELDIKFMKPVWGGQLDAVAEVTKKGRTTGLVECDIIDEEGSLVAKLNSVCLTLRGDTATGR